MKKRRAVTVVVCPASDRQWVAQWRRTLMSWRRHRFAGGAFSNAERRRWAKVVTCLLDILRLWRSKDSLLSQWLFELAELYNTRPGTNNYRPLDTEVQGDSQEKNRRRV